MRGISGSSGIFLVLSVHCFPGVPSIFRIFRVTGFSSVPLVTGMPFYCAITVFPGIYGFLVIACLRVILRLLPVSRFPGIYDFPAIGRFLFISFFISRLSGKRGFPAACVIGWIAILRFMPMPAVLRNIVMASNRLTHAVFFFNCPEFCFIFIPVFH